MHKDSIRVEPPAFTAEAQITTLLTWPERDLRKSVEKTDGTPILNQFPSITSKCMDQWKSHLKEFDDHNLYTDDLIGRTNISFAFTIHNKNMGLNIKVCI